MVVMSGIRSKHGLRLASSGNRNRGKKERIEGCMNTLLKRVRHLPDRLFGMVSYAQSPFLLCVRLYWGWQLWQSGWGKLHNLDKVTEFFTSLNMPAPGKMAVFIACVEFFGGIFFALGAFSRMTSLVLTVNLTMAYVLADREALFSVLSDPDKFTAAAPFNFLVASVLILIFGAGKLSLDVAAKRFLRHREAKQFGRRQTPLDRRGYRYVRGAYCASSRGPIGSGKDVGRGSPRHAARTAGAGRQGPRPDSHLGADLLGRGHILSLGRHPDPAGGKRKARSGGCTSRRASHWWRHSGELGTFRSVEGR